MKQPSNVVTNRQIIFAVFLLVTAYATIDLPKTVAESAGRIGWIPILLTAFIFASATLMTTNLNKMHPNKVMFDYSQEIVGKFFSKIMCLYYVLFFSIVGVYLKLKLVGILSSNVLPKTPPMVLLIVGIILFAYVSNKGITNVARMFEIISVLFLFITIVLCLFMISQGMPDVILPLFNPDEIQNILPSLWKLAIPFGGAEILFVIPFTAVNKKISKKMFVSMILFGVLYILVVESTIMILGINNTMDFTEPFIEAIKIVRLPVIERTDIFYLTFGLTSLFGGLIVAYTALIELVCKFLPKVRRVKVTISLAVIFFLLSMGSMKISNFDEIFASFAPFMVLGSGFLIPAILLIVKKIKKKKKAQQEA